MADVVLISGHYLGSKRRAGFHWIADALWRAGWNTTFVTAPISWLSWLRRDHRLRYPVRAEANRLVDVAPGLRSFVWWTRWHPASLRSGLLDRAVEPLYRRWAAQSLGALEPLLRAADCVIMESTPALLLAGRVRELNPAARLVYRVSDDLALIDVHPMVGACEAAAAAQFDLVSSPTPRIHEKFAHLPHARLQPHGVPANLFAASGPSPYDASFDAHAVFCGVARFDRAVLATAATARPRVAFHVVGPIGGLPARPNVFAHGEMPFEATVPYLRHADVGLQTILPTAGVEVFADSLKMQQYAWCGLPIVAPSALRTSRPNVVSYDPARPESIPAAIDAALALGRRAEWGAAVPAWDDVAAALAGAADDVAPRPEIATAKVHPNGCTAASPS